jgi:hypothetical protein
MAWPVQTRHTDTLTFRSSVDVWEDVWAHIEASYRVHYGEEVFAEVMKSALKSVDLGFNSSTSDFINVEVLDMILPDGKLLNSEFLNGENISLSNKLGSQQCGRDYVEPNVFSHPLSFDKGKSSLRVTDIFSP